MVLEHKCPLCGGIMNFQPAKGMLVCEYCDSEFDPKEYDNILKEMNDKMSEAELEQAKAGMGAVDKATFHEGEGTYEDADGSTFSEEDADNMVQFCCEACGAVLMTDKNTASTTCSYCDSPMIIGSRLSGVLAPDYIIPFKFDKKQANEKFNEWKKRGKFHPKGFMEATKVKELRGQYVPFWFYDLDSKGEIEAVGTKVKTYTRGNYRYTETSYYRINRKFNLEFANLPADASEKMDDTTMDMLEPFNAAEFVEFNTPYLTGYVAEKYDYTDKDLFQRINERASKYTNDYIKQTLSGYSSINTKKNDIKITSQKAKYALLPIWFFNYKYNDVMYSFTMNGQTGKVIGKPPISKPKVAAFFGVTTAVLFVGLRLLMSFIGGTPLW